MEVAVGAEEGEGEEPRPLAQLHEPRVAWRLEEGEEGEARNDKWNM